MTRLANYLASSSSYATREQKKATMDAIISSGVNGITSREIRKANGLTQYQQMRLMHSLACYGACRKVGVIYKGNTSDIIWSAVY